MNKQNSTVRDIDVCRYTKKSEGLRKLLLFQALLIISAVMATVFFSAPVSAAVTQNLYYDLATDPLTEWTQSGTGIRTGIRLESYGNTLTFSRYDLDIDDKAFQIEAVVSASPLSGDGERGARFWAWFGDTTLLPPGDIFKVYVSLIRGAGVNRLDLYDDLNILKATLNLDWTNVVDRLRIRLKRQRVGGQDYLFLQAEPSSGWDDPANPNNLSDANSVAVPLSTFTSGAGASEVGFGNIVPDIYISEWESIHITTTNDLTTVLPYWPETPPTPALAYENIGQGCLQRVTASTDLTSMYLSNDSAISSLNANGVLYTGATRTNPGNEIWSFDGISCTQAVSGRITVSDVSGRSRTSSSATLNQGIAQNLYYDLATDPLTEWTATGTGRTGIHLLSNGSALTFTRSDLAIDYGVAFQIEAVVSAEMLSSGERGTRLWVQFHETGLAPLARYRIEARMSASGGVRRLELVDGTNIVGTLDLDWAATAPRLRIRLKRQQISGQDYIFLQAEPSSGWDNPSQPNNLSDTNSVGLLLSNFTPTEGTSEIGFGNVGAGFYYSDWESIHITITNDLTTVLPYWPPAPPAPSILHEDSGVGCVQRVDLSDDLGSRYLSNDSASSTLDVNGTISSGATRTNPGSEVWYFDGIDCGQSVTGSVTVSDVSGRSTTSNATTSPALTHPLTVAVSGTGTGTVTPAPTGASCGTGCYEYTSGTAVGLNVSASVDSEFTGWAAGSDADCGDNSVTMNYDKTCTAIFTLKAYTVTAAATGDGTGTITSGTSGISYSYPTDSTGTTPSLVYGSDVVLTATAGSGSIVSWTACAGAVSGNGTPRATCTLSNLVQNETAEATFTVSPYMLNLYYDLATDPLSSWTAYGTGVRTGIKLQNGGNNLVYGKSDLTLSDTAFQIEAVLSAEPLPLDGEQGTRIWAWFGDPALPPGNVYQVEVRLIRSNGIDRVALFDGAAGTSQATLERDWTNAGIRNRVRLKRQRVDGQDYLFLQAEPSSGWDDPANPNNLSDANSVGVPLSNFISGPGSNEVGFGNMITGAYYSEWESIHITTTNDPSVVLPYWPPAPPAPAVLHEDSGSGCVQRVDLSADLSGMYLSNDSAASALDASGTLYTGATRTNPGSEVWYFDGIDCGQSVTGSVTVSDVSGRSRASMTAISGLTHPLTLGISGTGAGAVTPAPTGSSCGAGCYEYTSGTVVGLAVSPSANSEFTGWAAGSDADCADSSVVMNSDKTCIAAFTLKAFTVTTNATNGTITSTNNPIVVYGMTTTVTGTADANHYFIGVSGCGGVAQSNTDRSITSFSHTTGAITANCAVTATFAVNDTTPPQLTLSTLADGSYTNNPVLNIAGTVTDDIAVQSLLISGQTVTFDADGNFSHSITLQPGANVIETVATDTAGNTDTDVRTVTLDESAPGLTITAPADNSITNELVSTITGTVDETATVAVKLNDDSPLTAAMDGDSFMATVNLASGMNTIDITVTDLAGNTSSVKRTVTYDAVAPSLAVTLPAQDSLVTSPTITIEGTVSDELTTISVLITTGTATYFPEIVSGAFSQSVTLPAEGTYGITVTAVDEAGNTSTVVRNVIYVVLGDLDEDGDVDTVDALNALRIAAGIDAPTEDEKLRGDVAPLVDGTPAPDNEIGVGDVVVILRRAVGLISW